LWERFKIDVADFIDPPTPIPAGRIRAKGPPYRMTFYYLADFEDPKTWMRKRKRDPVLTKIKLNGAYMDLPTGFMRAVKMQGSGQYKGAILNYTGGKNPKWVFQNPEKYPWGRGAAGLALHPFRSMAIDRTRVKLRRWYVIPELMGHEMPDGTIHNGRVRALDTGGAIKGKRVDFFIGKRAWWLWLLRRRWVSGLFKKKKGMALVHLERT